MITKREIRPFVLMVAAVMIGGFTYNWLSNKWNKTTVPTQTNA